MLKKTLLATALTLSAGAAFAVSNVEYNAALQFNFSNPGARSLGMGGAYLGFSDDATAAYTNPAGLTVLDQFEVAAEFRYSGFDTPFVSSPNGVEATTSSSTSSPSYFAVVWPMERGAVAFYRNVEMDFESSYASDQIPFTFAGSNRIVLPRATTIEAQSVNYGLSGAYEVNEQLSLGISAVYTLFDFAAGAGRQRTDGSRFFELEGSDQEKYTYNLGLLYKFSDKLSMGAAYRRGGEFDTQRFLVLEDRTLSDVGEFNIPHQFSLGVAYRATENFALGFDAHFVQYSTLNDDPLREQTGNKNEVDSGVELRLGAEYVFTQFDAPFTVRAGLWNDPEHRFSFRGTPTTFEQAADQILFREGDNELHYSFGFGWAFEQLQIDAGADFSDLVDTYSISAGLRF